MLQRQCPEHRTYCRRGSQNIRELDAIGEAFRMADRQPAIAAIQILSQSVNSLAYHGADPLQKPALSAKMYAVNEGPTPASRSKK